MNKQSVPTIQLCRGSELTSKGIIFHVDYRKLYPLPGVIRHPRME
jgi:hypothetical protein